jgi:hypothetical protein
MPAYHWSGYEEGLVRKRVRRPKLRVIAGGGGKADFPAIGASVAAAAGASKRHAAEEAAFIPPLRAQPADKPRPSATEARLHRYYEQQHDRRNVAANIDRLRHAIVDLAAIELPASQLLQELSPQFDRPVIRERLIKAIDCLSGFAEAWCEDETLAIPPERAGESGES